MMTVAQMSERHTQKKWAQYRLKVCPLLSFRGAEIRTGSFILSLVAFIKIHKEFSISFLELAPDLNSSSIDVCGFMAKHQGSRSFSAMHLAVGH